LEQKTKSLIVFKGVTAMLTRYKDGQWEGVGLLRRPRADAEG